MPLLGHFHPPLLGPRRWEQPIVHLVEVRLEILTLGSAPPLLPLELCMPLHLEESYLAPCRSLRIPA